MQNLSPLTRGQLMSITGFVAHLSSHFAHQLSVISKWEKRHQAALFWRAVQTLGLILSSKSYYVASAQVEHFSLVLSHRCCWLHPSLDGYVLSNMHNLFVDWLRDSVVCFFLHGKSWWCSYHKVESAGVVIALSWVSNCSPNCVYGRNCKISISTRQQHC